MLERVRLHPGLITGNRDAEIAATRWRTMEIQDVVMECAKMSLDVMEGMWDDSSESLKKNILYKPLEQSKSKDITFQTRAKNGENAVNKLLEQSKCKDSSFIN